MDALKKTKKERNKECKLRKRQRNRALIHTAKNAPCMDCGVTYPFYVMQFDHRQGETKKFGLGGIDPSILSVKAILDEIKKCDVVCSNCHHIRTYKRMQADG